VNVHTPHLSLRELQVLHLAAEGLTAKETAKLLNLSESAVNLYICHARQKLGAKTKAEAIAMMMDSGELTRGNIEKVKVANRSGGALQTGPLQDMLMISNRIRHLAEVMLLADVAGKADHGDLAVWSDLAEKFLKMAAHSCGYRIEKVLEEASGM
jgi:DNA-binding CsgD family transcriptional regulator